MTEKSVTRRVARPLTIFACAIPAEGAPILPFFLQAWVATLRALFDFVVDT